MPLKKYVTLTLATLYGTVLFAQSAQAQASVPLQLTITKEAPRAIIDSQREAEEAIAQIAGNVALVDDGAWEGQFAATVKDIFDYVPSVVVAPRNGAESARLSIRGSGLATNFQGRGLLVLQDGIPITMADGEFEFPTIDPWLIRYAEVYPGANALEYGASSFGGAVNFVTPDGRTAPDEQIRDAFGSFGTFHEQLAAARQWSGGDIYASATDFRQDGFRDNNEQHTMRLNSNIGWNPADDFSTRFYLSHTDSDAHIPGTLSRAEIADNPAQANPANRARFYARDVDVTRLGNRSIWEEGDDRVETTLYYIYRTLDNPVTTYEFAHNNDTGARIKYTRQVGRSQWLTGVNFAYGDSDEERLQNTGSGPGAPILTRDLEATTSEWYGQYEQHLGGAFFGILGAQAAYATRDIRQHTPIDATQTEDYSGFSPRVGLRADLSANLQLFANLSRSFEPPSFAELSGGNSPGFNQLNAQRATMAEIGGRGDMGTLHWSAAYYHGWLRDEFVNYRFPDNSTDTINVPRSMRDGVEFGLDSGVAANLWSTGDALVLRAAYTFSDFTLENDPLYGDNRLPGVPEHLLRAELLYRHPSGVSIGPDVEWVPKGYPVDLTNTVSTAGYAIFGARALWESEGGQMNIYLEARNLLDRNYVATANAVPDANGLDGRYFYPGEGRAFYAGLRLQF